MTKSEMSDHDMLRQVYFAIYDDGGLRMEVGTIKSALLGTMNGKEGLIFRFNEHIENHTRERNRIIVILTAVATGVGGLVSWVLDFLFRR